MSLAISTLSFPTRIILAAKTLPLVVVTYKGRMMKMQHSILYHSTSDPNFCKIIKNCLSLTSSIHVYIWNQDLKFLGFTNIPGRQKNYNKLWDSGSCLWMTKFKHNTWTSVRPGLCPWRMLSSRLTILGSATLIWFFRRCVIFKAACLLMK